MKSRFTSRLKVAALALPIAFFWTVTNEPTRAFAAVIANGTVMVGTGNGKVTEFDQNGTILRQLDTTTGTVEETGSAFDSSGNFFVTDFAANKVSEFDPSGTLIGPFGSGYNVDPESIVFDASGNVYVGQADGTHNVLEFNSSGTFAQYVLPRRGDARDGLDRIGGRQLHALLYVRRHPHKALQCLHQHPVG